MMILRPAAFSWPAPLRSSCLTSSLIGLTNGTIAFIPYLSILFLCPPRTESLPHLYASSVWVGTMSAIEVSLSPTGQVSNEPMNGGTHGYTNRQAESSQGVPSLALTCWVTLYKFLHFSELWFPYLSVNT